MILGLLFVAMIIYSFFDVLNYIKTYNTYSLKEHKKRFNRIAFNVFVITLYLVAANIKRVFYPSITSLILDNLALFIFSGFTGLVILVAVYLLRYAQTDETK